MGRGLAKLLALKGANVVIVARSEDKLAKAVDYISVCSVVRHIAATADRP